MTTRDLIQKLKAVEGISETHEIYLKASGGGQWGELRLRRVTSEERQNAGNKSKEKAVVIAAEGDAKFNVKSLTDGLRRLPESSEVYAMRYLQAGDGQLGKLIVMGLASLTEEGASKKVVAISAQEISPKNPIATC
jgi:hypothetical protein